VIGRVCSLVRCDFSMFSICAKFSARIAWGLGRLNPLSSLERTPSFAKFQPSRGRGVAEPLAHWHE